MLISASLLLAAALATPADTTVVLGRTERDLTGDGKPEILKLVGVGKTIDSLDVTLTIESSGKTIFRLSFVPITRRIGFDGDREMRTSAQQREFLAGYGQWIFAPGNFKRPSTFLSEWPDQSPERVPEIPMYIAQAAGFYPDTARAVSIWAEMQRNAITIFEFSPGGDAIVAIGWSSRNNRFYHLMSCC